VKIQQDTRSVYIILNEENDRIKIGYSSDPNKRVAGLMTQSGCVLRLLYFTKPIYNYSAIEKCMHNLFHEERLIGEWFSANANIAIERLKSMSHNVKVCSIISKFEKGNNATVIAKQLNVSRSGVVKYLKSRGYMLAPYEIKKIPIKNKKPPVKQIPIIGLSSDRIAEMVRKQKQKKEDIKK